MGGAGGHVPLSDPGRVVPQSPPLPPELHMAPWARVREECCGASEFKGVSVCAGSGRQHSSAGVSTRVRLPPSLRQPPLSAPPPCAARRGVSVPRPCAGACPSAPCCRCWVPSHVAASWGVSAPAPLSASPASPLPCCRHAAEGSSPIPSPHSSVPAGAPSAPHGARGRTADDRAGPRTQLQLSPWVLWFSAA